MDDESGEFMEKAELEDQSPRWRDRHEAVGDKQGVDSRDGVRHSKKTDQLFVKIKLKADGKE